MNYFNYIVKYYHWLSLYFNVFILVDSEDEEFFDCQTESKDDSNFKAAKVSLWNQPEGRLRKFNNLRLIETGEFMFIPITQVLS